MRKVPVGVNNNLLIPVLVMGGGRGAPRLASFFVFSINITALNECTVG